MATIDIKDLATLNLDGNDLFTDSESFMVELSDSSEQKLILGGCQVGPSCLDMSMSIHPTSVPTVTIVE